MTISIRNLHEKTAQEVFDYIVNHLRTQKEPARSENGRMCMYRGVSPTTSAPIMCAAGCLIPDDLYSPRIERQRWTVVAHQLASIMKINIPVSHQELIEDLQSVHDLDFMDRQDRYAVPLNLDVVHKYWEERLQKVAAEYHLTYTAPINENHNS